MNKIEQKVKDFLEFKKKHNKEFTDYCRENQICLKCHNPNKPIKEGNSSCDECLGKMRSYYHSRNKDNDE